MENLKKILSTKHFWFGNIARAYQQQKQWGSEIQPREIRKQLKSRHFEGWFSNGRALALAIAVIPNIQNQDIFVQRKETRSERRNESAENTITIAPKYSARGPKTRAPKK